MATMATDTELLQQNAELTALLRLSQAAMEDLPLQAIIDCALDQIMTVFSPEQAFLYHTSGATLVLAGARPLQGIALPGHKEIGQCLCGLAAKLAKPIFSRDINCDPRCTLNECKEAGVRSFASLPLTVDGELLGIMCLASLGERDFTIHQAQLERMAAVCTLAIKKNLTVATLERKVLELRDQLDDRTTELTLRSNELERLNRLFVTREFRIKALRDRVKALKGQQ